MYISLKKKKFRKKEKKYLQLPCNLSHSCKSRHRSQKTYRSYTHINMYTEEFQWNLDQVALVLHVVNRLRCSKQFHAVDIHCYRFLKMHNCPYDPTQRRQQFVGTNTELAQFEQRQWLRHRLSIEGSNPTFGQQQPPNPLPSQMSQNGGLTVWFFE